MIKVDPEKSEASIAAMVEGMKPALNEPGFKGVLARMQSTATPALVRFREAEINRGSDPTDVGNALMLLFATTLMSEACAIWGLDPSDNHYSYINNMLKGIAAEFEEILTGNADYVTKSAVSLEVSGSA